MTVGDRGAEAGLIGRSILRPLREGSDVVAFSESEVKTSPSERLEDLEVIVAITR